MTTSNITVTDGRMKRALEKRMEPFVHKEATKIVQKALDESMARLGKVTKVYPYLDKAEVKLLQSKKKVLCKLPHHYMGNIIDLYVPQGERAYCEKLKEPCIVPLSPLPCVVLKICEKDSSEYFIVDYYTQNDLLYISPPDHGHARLTCMTATNETFVEFGGKGLKVLSSKPLKIGHGIYENDITDVDYADSSKVYTKEEVDDALKDISTETDLTEVYNRLDELQNEIDNIEPSSSSDVDLSDYVKKDDLTNNAKYDIDLNLNFGLSGLDDSITIDMDIVNYIVNKTINTRGVINGS